MKYYSTRNQNLQPPVSSAQAIKQGLAADGGLFLPLPDELPHLSSELLSHLRGVSYAERAARIMKLFLDDYTEEELLSDCRAAYAEDAFPGGPAPLVELDSKHPMFSMELWHGPTAAFKDMALQIMPRLLSRALKKTGETRTALILVATSGDTGKAALEGYRDIPQTRMVVFYPVDGVSQVQKLQMATQEGANVDVLAIRGNFDDAQSGVKQIFSDPGARTAFDQKGYLLSSANSINWGRLLPQIVYYISAYCDLLNRGTLKEGDAFHVCVPTGNFGNIFAAYLAGRMGVPIGKLVCASNSNCVLTDFLTTGVYDRNRPFHLTMSPSMDILISSNLERLLFYTAGMEKTASYMQQLQQTGSYQIDDETRSAISERFVGLYADEAQTAETIHTWFHEKGYLCDTHTAVALCCAQRYRKCSGDTTPMVVASTASPYKFAKAVFRSISGRDAADDLSALEELHQLSGVPIPYPLRDLKDRKVRFTRTIDKGEMLSTVLGDL